MKKFVKLSLAAAVATAGLTSVASANTLAEAFAASKASGEIKAMYFTKEKTNGVQADISVVGGNLNITTGDFNGLSATASFQTSHVLSVDDTKDIIEILKKNYPKIKEPLKEDICYATTNRQMAVKNIAKKCDMFFVIGSRNSSNSVRLVEVAKNSGCENSYLVHSQSKIPYDDINKCSTIGISSGASAPDVLVNEFIKQLKQKFSVITEEVEIIKENVIFKVPNKLN